MMPSAACQRYGDGEAQGMGHEVPDMMRLWGCLLKVPRSDIAIGRRHQYPCLGDPLLGLRGWRRA